MSRLQQIASDYIVQRSQKIIMSLTLTSTLRWRSSYYMELTGDLFFFFFSSRRRHTRLQGDWSSDVCSSDLSAVVTTSSEPPNEDRRHWEATPCVLMAASTGGPAALLSLVPRLGGDFPAAVDRKSVV